jgi:hypothetical protein
MGRLIKIAAVGFAGFCLVLGVLGIRWGFHALTTPKAPPLPVSVQVPAVQPTPEVTVFETADPIGALASLTDFQKLATLNPQTRPVNPRVKKILYWLFVAERKGIPPEQAIDRAFAQNGNARSRKAAGAKSQTITNFRTAKILGLFTADGLPLLKRGHAVKISNGTYAGEFIEIDHIVPLARYPQFGDELANLQLLPQSQNRSKGDRMGAVEFLKLKELQELSK